MSLLIKGAFGLVGQIKGRDSVAPVPPSPTGNLLWSIPNQNFFGTSSSDYFGNRIAISGNYTVVSTHLEDSAGNTNTGIVYVYDTSTGTLLRTIENPNVYGTPDSDEFGISVAIDGTNLIVGAWGEDDAGATNSGKAYIFDVTTGSLLHTLNNPNAYSTAELDYFGNSVAISGNYCVVGAPFEDSAAATNSGRAYIFDVTTGSLLHTLGDPAPTSTAFSFDSLAMSGNYIVVGAYQSESSGKVYIYDITSGTPATPVHTINNPNAYDTAIGDNFGISVSVHGNYIIVGANGEDDVGASYSGKAYIFDVTTGSLLHTLNNPTPADNDNFGASVAISGNYAVVGAYSDDTGAPDSGSVYVFAVDTGTLLLTLDNANIYSTPDSDYFGRQVAIDGTNIIVTAMNEKSATGETASGAVYIYN